MNKEAFRQLREREMQRDIRFRVWHQGNKTFTYEDYELMKPISQFTGQKDKKGREIWQDDLIQDSNGRTCIVKWHKCIAGWDAWDDKIMKFMGKDRDFNPHNWADAVVVVGNIYEGKAE
jgi:hypothetical protein